MAEQESFPWIKLAEQDLFSARHLASLMPRPVEVICFLCQQSAEKVLKAILVSEGRPSQGPTISQHWPNRCCSSTR
jgi:HEPN domain-containing protein